MTRLRNIFTALMLAAGAASMPAMAAVDAMQHELPSTTSSVQVRSGAVELAVSGSDPVAFQIFAITGQQVKSIVVPAGTSITVDLPKGIYIVRGDHWAKQVVIR